MHLATDYVITPYLVPISKRFSGQGADTVSGAIVLCVTPNAFLLDCTTQLFNLSSFNLRSERCRLNGVVRSKVGNPCVVVEDRPFTIKLPECHL